MQVFAVFALLAACANDASAVLIDYNASSQPTGLVNVLVDGTYYDVTIRYNESFNDVYSSDLMPSNLPFSTEGGAQGAAAARDALRAALNAEGVFPTINTVVPVPAADSSLTTLDFSNVPQTIYQTAFPGDLYNTGVGTSSRSVSNPNIGFSEWVESPIVYDSLQRPTFVRDVIFNDASYDVTIRYNESFNDVYSSDLIPSNLPFSTEGGAQGATAARDALRAALNAGGVFPTINTVVPVPAADSSLTTSDFTNVPHTIYQLVFPGDLYNTGVGTLSRSASDPTIGFSEWTLVSSGDVVPEPSTFALAVLGMSLLGMNRRRRRRSAP